MLVRMACQLVLYQMVRFINKQFLIHQASSFAPEMNVIHAPEGTVGYDYKRLNTAGPTTRILIRISQMTDRTFQGVK